MLFDARIYSKIFSLISLQLSPASGVLESLADLTRRTDDLGYRGLWSGEVNTYDVVAPATVIAANSRQLEVAGLFNIFIRAPSTTAMAGAALATLAPGRAIMLLGASSPLLVERWAGITYAHPYDRLADYLTYLRQALGGGQAKGPFRRLEVSGFALSDPPPVPPRLLVAAAGKRALRLGLEGADGVVLNWVAPHDLDTFLESDGDRSNVWLSIIVSPHPDPSDVDAAVRSMMADYLAAPAYAAIQRQVGRGPALEPMWTSWAAGNRKEARARLPRAVIEELVVSGTPEQCGDQLRAIERSTGASVVATVFTHGGCDFDDIITRMAGPASSCPAPD
jgi:probable F420-dependent oxidoreductase